MKKLSVAYIFDKEPGIFQPYLQDFIQEILKTDEISVGIFFFSRKIRKSEDRRVKFIKSYSFKDYLFRLLFKVRLIQYSNYFEYCLRDYDIIHFKISYLKNKINANKPFYKSKIVIFTLRGADTYLKPHIDDSWRLFFTDTYNVLNSFIVMSNHQKRYLNEIWKVPNNKINVISPGIKLVNNQYPKILKPIRLISVFRMCWEKSIYRNFKFVHYLIKKGLKIRYTIYGDGNDFQQLFYLRTKFGLENIIDIRGKANSEEIHSSLVKHNFYLQLSETESLGVSILEAQGRGLPAIIYKNGDGITETINENTGLCIDDETFSDGYEFIKDLSRNEKRYNNFSRCAKENASKNFSLENEIRNLTNIYLSY